MWEATADVMLKGEGLKTCPLRSGTTYRCSLLPPLFTLVPEARARAVRQEKDRKGIKIWKEEVKLFADGVILYREDPKDSTKKLKTNKFSEVAGYKLKIQKSVAFLHASIERSAKWRKQCYLQ